MNDGSNDDNNMRLIFRPTTQQYQRIQQYFQKGRYKHLSELLRDITNRGLDQLDKEEINNVDNKK